MSKLPTHDILTGYAKDLNQFYATFRIFYFQGEDGQKFITKHYLLIKQKQEKIQSDYNIQCPLPEYIIFDKTYSQSTFINYLKSQQIVGKSLNFLFLATSNTVVVDDDVIDKNPFLQNTQ